MQCNAIPQKRYCTLNDVVGRERESIEKASLTHMSIHTHAWGQKFGVFVCCFVAFEYVGYVSLSLSQLEESFLSPSFSILSFFPSSKSANSGVKLHTH